MRSTQWVDAKEKLETGTAVASDYLAVLKLKNRFERRIVRWTRILLSGLCILLLGSCAGGYVDKFITCPRGSGDKWSAVQVSLDAVSKFGG
jgi:hypothetical protein